MLVNQVMATLGGNPLEPNKFIKKFSMKIHKKGTVGYKFDYKIHDSIFIHYQDMEIKFFYSAT